MNKVSGNNGNLAWGLMDFPPCSTQCGQAAATQRREVYCVNHLKQQIPINVCAEVVGPIPPVSRECPATGACPNTQPSNVGSSKPPGASSFDPNRRPRTSGGYQWTIISQFPSCEIECGKPRKFVQRGVQCRALGNRQHNSLGCCVRSMV